MEHCKISSPVSKFLTNRLYSSEGLYSANKNIRFKSPMLSSNLCDYCDAYVVKGRINVTGTYNANRKNKKANL